MPESTVLKSAAVMVNGDTLFTATGDVVITHIYSECVTANGVTASTLQYSITPTGLVATTISGASSSLASAIIGTTVSLDGTALSTAPTVSVNGTAQGTTRGVLFLSGVLKIVVGVGSTTGTWKHYLRYFPVEAGAYVS